MPATVYAPTVTYKLIYVYKISDLDHAGLLKIGMTSLNSSLSEGQLTPNCDALKTAAKARIIQQTQTALVQNWELLHTELARRTLIMADGTQQTNDFQDKHVHKVLKASHHPAIVFLENGQDSEWFSIDLNTAIRAINAVKEGRHILLPEVVEQQNEVGNDTPIQQITLREEQEECVNKTIENFKSNNTMLWDCKMRFGKTVTAYELIRRMNLQKVIVITHRPAVEDGWDKDHNLIFAGTDHIFKIKTGGSEDDFDEAIDRNNDQLLNELEENGTHFTYFASIQDLRGSQRVGGKHNKNNSVFDMQWDLLIIDEAHEGTQTDLGDKVIKAIAKDSAKILSLSGTPYNLINDYESNVFSWTYVDEQTKKVEWASLHPGEPNPYAELPTMNIYTFDLCEAIPESYLFETEDSAFNFREFFRTWTGDERKDFLPVPADKHIGDFVYEKQINQFLSLISSENTESNYPFSTEERRNMFKHTFWLLPGVKEARAFSTLLKQHEVFKKYEIVNVAGDGDEEAPYDVALDAVRKAINNHEYTITLSCGKLTTGVTVREWTACMMLTGSANTSAGGYMQAIFRVQSPGIIDGKRKDNCYVFDFAPDRTLKVLADVHSIKRKGTEVETTHVALGKFLNFCPVLAMDKTNMRVYDVTEMIRQIKRISIEAAINTGFDDDIIYKPETGIVMSKTDENILQKLSDVVTAQKKGKRKTSVNINNQGLTNEQYQQAQKLIRKPPVKLTPEQKALLAKLKKQREEQKKVFDLLRSVAIRLPLLFYGAPADITEVIHLQDFVQIVDDESWEEFMPHGLKKDFFLDLLRFFDEDVVTGAGIRIRRLAKAADHLPPTKRAARIVEILSKFRNPDKETVLTPWRVVNMHLGDTIGGYNFFSDNYTKELDEPQLKEIENVTSNILLNPEAKILEMNSKSGLYPLYMAYSFYLLLLDGSEHDATPEQTKQIWADTLKNHIFVLCKTKMAQSITKRTLAGYTDTPVNTTYMTKLITRMEENPQRVANKLRNPETWNREGERMTFDAVVGNPPYQLNTGGGQAQGTPLYDKFVLTARQINPKYISIIHPARWYAGGFACIKTFRDIMVKEKRIHFLHDFQDATECFPSVDIKGGICYYLWENDYCGQCIIYNHKNGIIISKMERDLQMKGNDTIIRDNDAISILEKINSVTNEKFSSLISALWPFTTISSFASFTEKKQCDDDIYAYVLKQQGWIRRKEITRNIDLVDSIKLFIPRSIGSANPATDKIKSILAEKNSCCSGTYLVCGPFDSKEIAENVQSYIDTKFFHFLLAQKKVSQDTVKGTYDYIPMQDFTKKWTDKMLYEKYELSEKEIAHIEKTIWPK